MWRGGGDPCGRPSSLVVVLFASLPLDIATKYHPYCLFCRIAPKGLQLALICFSKTNSTHCLSRLAGRLSYHESYLSIAGPRAGVYRAVYCGRGACDKL